MLRQWRSSLSLAPILAALAIAETAPLARADAPRAPPGGPDDSAAAGSKRDADPSDGPGFGDPSQNAPATISAHAYTLTECLALADRNFPNLWAARARLAYTHAQLEEAKWTPWFQWTAQSSFGVAPSLQGSVLYPQANLQQRNITTLGNLQPFVGYGLSGVVPLYTFGKIETAREAAEANVRVSEWDMEKWRQSMRMDVRRAYYGVQLARDAHVVFTDAMDRLDKGIQGIREKLAKADPNVTEVDRLRLEEFKQEVISQSLTPAKGEAYALAALRFMTGVQSGFDVPDEPLKRPDRPLVAIAQYLEAARVLRPDVNMARAGIVARRALAEYNRAKLFPDIGLGAGADFVSTPSAVPQNNLWASDGWNHFYYYFGFGLKWSLDLLPQAARIQEAESQLEETRALERLALGNAMLEVEKAYADALEAKAREETWDKAEHIAKQWISTVQDHIDLGTWDERSLLEPLRSYAGARGQHLYALMDYNVSLSSLAQASGWDSAAPTAE
ncbi:MAG TPA: TolC family protein [Polyangiaceae bacterium]|nr:TolC family protein [Polyangiaceae bacterium]